MYKTRIIFWLLYVIALISAYLLRNITQKIVQRAIEEKKLTSGIYRFAPVYGRRAVDLAKGHLFAARIFFWFIALIIPFAYLLLIMLGAI